MKRVWTILGITAITGIILVGAVVWGAIALIPYGDGAPFTGVAVFGGMFAVGATICVFVFLDEEVPK